MLTLTEAKRTVSTLLSITNGDPDKVHAALVESNRKASQYEDYTREDIDDFGMLLLALTDITGEAKYRYMTR